MNLLVSTNGHAKQISEWSTLSVRDFFNKIAWTGEPLPQVGPADAGTAAAVPTLDMRLNVGEFFNRFPWDGTPDIAVPTVPLEVQPDLPPVADDLTLDGFADLF